MPNNFDYALANTTLNAEKIRELALDDKELEHDRKKLKEKAAEIASKLKGLETIQGTYRMGYGIGDRVVRKDGQEFLVTSYGGWSFSGIKKTKSGGWAKSETHIYDAKRI